MSYGKKDEDADLGLVKVDRTQVFQEGEPATNPTDNSSDSPFRRRRNQNHNHLLTLLV